MTGLMKPLAQIGPIALAVWISMTRVADYHHHLTDVVGGFLLGIITGMAGAMHAAQWLSKHSPSYEEELCGVGTNRKNDIGYGLHGAREGLNATATQKTILDESAYNENDLPGPSGLE